jgi:hypothetical protein
MGIVEGGQLHEDLEALHEDMLVLTRQIVRLRRLLLALFLRESSDPTHRRLVEAHVEEELKTDQHSF